MLIWDLRSNKIVNKFYGATIIGEQVDFHDNYLAVGSNSLKDALTIYDIRNSNTKLKEFPKDFTV